MPTHRDIASLDLVGGVSCLDLANTINSRVAPAHDYLSSYGDLLDWCQRIGTVHDNERKALERRARRSPRKARDALRRAVAQRESTYRVFSDLTRGARPPESDLQSVLRTYAQSIRKARLDGTPAGLRPSWDVDSELLGPLRAVAYAAGQLLTSPELERVKECPGCRWLFLDATRNGSRRWCDMATCGSRDKMRRYYRRRRLSPAVAKESASEPNEHH